MAVVLVVALAQPLAAQDAPPARPYSQIRLRVAGARNVNREPVHDFWRAATGGGVAISTPFYLGVVGAGATLIPYRTLDPSRPDFRALMLALDWGFDLPSPRWIRLHAAARVGDFVMLIENPDLWLDSESELFVGGELAAALPLRRGFAISAAAFYARAHTNPPLDLAIATIGVEYTARTPRWLRAILE